MRTSDWIQIIFAPVLASWITGTSPGRAGMAMERYQLHSVKVYQRNICETIAGHDVDACPGLTILKAGDFELGTVACDCPCLRSQRTKYRSNGSTTATSPRYYYYC
jgi:hypothetical protein